MPTGAKLVGAILFFGIGWVAAMQAKLTFEEGTAATYFNITIAMIGFFNGWMLVGKRAGEGIAFGAANGVRASAQIAVLGLIIFALRTMFLRSANLRYSSIGEATTEAMDLLVQYSLQAMTVPIWTVLIVGGFVGGILTELAAKVWR
ncbi:TrgA family protein [Jannaschia sp. CCS1]|uniref:TrgA family protein n=1 Tax=Jannaschia sp. (strain CCS1) TaxID=290400 RepID=UPI000053AD27|nr:TrgA family protein [Jannaschia sp. CCS1]ABD54908.1 hypothetical protein Jann_1991 [Jannaschia sp. CCS1]